MERGKGVASHDDYEEGEGGAEQQELPLGVKLRRGISIGKRGGPCTPLRTWKLEEAGPSGAHYSTTIPTNNNRVHSKQQQQQRHTAATAFSSRKLGANLWEIQDILPLSGMSRSGAQLRHHKDEKPVHLSDRSPLGPHDRPRSASSLRRHVAASLIQHHKSTDRNGRVIKPASPASYSSSMEVAAYNQVITPTNSLDLKGRIGEPGYILKTSTELLKVLNRIWTLEEQHASNISLVKALKLELEHAQVHIQELVQEQQAHRHEMEDLMKQITEDKLVRKNKEQEMIKAALQSIKDELEDERRLRRRSESLHRKLAKELSEVRSAFSKSLKALKREKKAHGLLEDLCDEFAKGVGDYEQEVRELKQNSERGCDRRCDRLIHHISETWLDERLQMKLAETRGDLSVKNTIIDRLRYEVKTFLQARRSNSFNKDAVIQKDARKDSCLRRHSLESVHLNGSVSAPQDAEDEDSIASDLHCFELNMVISDAERHENFKPNSVRGRQKLEQASKSSTTKMKMGYCERIKGQSSSSFQVQLEEEREACNGSKMQFMNRVHGNHMHNTTESGADASHIEVVAAQKSENGEAREGGQAIKVKRDVMRVSNHMIDNSLTCESDIALGRKTHHDDDHRRDSCDVFSWREHSVTVGGDNASCDYRSLSSPLKQWSYHLTCPDLEISECSSKLPRGVNENTLKAKLLEARLEGKHARLKTSKCASFGGLNDEKE